MRLGALLEGEAGPDTLGFARQLNAPHLLPVRTLTSPHLTSPHLTSPHLTSPPATWRPRPNPGPLTLPPSPYLGAPPLARRPSNP